MRSSEPAHQRPFMPAPRFTWPRGNRCAAMLCFDVDGETTALSEDPAYARRRTLMSQCEYGPRIGVPRILELLDHLAVPATFFVPAYIAEQHPSMVEAIVARGHELGLHGYLHEKLITLTEAEEESILLRSIEILTRISGVRPTGYRAPWFEINPWTPALLQRHGIEYCASEMGDDVPYLHENGLVEIPGQWLLEDWEQFAFSADPAWGFVPENCAKVFDLWWREFEAMHDFGCCFVLTLHPWLSGRPSRIRLLEELLNAIRERGATWLARGGEIASWFREHPRARRELDLDHPTLSPPAVAACSTQPMIAQASQFTGAFTPPEPAQRHAARTLQKPLALGEICNRINDVADLPLARASTIPAQAYTSDEFFSWEIDHLLRNDWQCIAHVSQIPAPGDFLNIDLLGEPLIVVHGKEGAIRVLSRVCPHRAMDIMPHGFGYDGHGPAQVREGSPDCGHTRLFLCPYHAWTFELDGKLKACPEMHQAESFCRGDIGLATYRSAVWHGLVFVNLDGNAAPFEAGMEDIDADLAPYHLAEMKLVIAREWECEFNWKVLVENFMESYHHLGIHSKTLQPMMPARDTWTEQERRRYARAHLPYKPEVLAKSRALAAAGKPAGFPLLPDLRSEQQAEWGLFLLYPHTLLATTEDRVIWYRIQPIAPDRIRLLTTTLVAPEVFDCPNVEALIAEQADMLYAFHLEDMEVCTAVQRGLYSSAWQPGRLSHLEMPVWLFHRYLAARTRGVWPTEDRAPAASQRQDIDTRHLGYGINEIGYGVI